MNRFHTAVFATVALLATGAASAAQPVQYRAEVYPEAQMRARDAAQPAPAVTRAQVLAELDAARRSGDLVVGEVGLKHNELYASQSARGAVEGGKTVELARAERLEARFAGVTGTTYVN
jgi:hypothetical protein